MKPNIGIFLFLIVLNSPLFLHYLSSKYQNIYSQPIHFNQYLYIWSYFLDLKFDLMHFKVFKFTIWTHYFQSIFIRFSLKFVKFFYNLNILRLCIINLLFYILKLQIFRFNLNLQIIILIFQVTNKRISNLWKIW